MIEFTFMGRRYGLFAARLTQLGMPDGDPTPATPGDLEAAGYRKTDQPTATESPIDHATNWDAAYKLGREHMHADLMKYTRRIDDQNPYRKGGK